MALRTLFLSLPKIDKTPEQYFSNFTVHSLTVTKSHNQLVKEKKKKKNPKGKNFKNAQLLVLYSCNHNTVKIKHKHNENANKNGHGLGLTRWNGCC